VTVKVILKPHFNDSAFTITALVLPRLTVYTDSSNVTTRSWSHLENLELADPKFLSSDSVDILFGADVFAAILAWIDDPRESIAQKTVLGIISGRINSPEKVNFTKKFAHQCLTTDSLAELVKRFWEQEFSSKPSKLPKEEQQCENLYITLHTNNEANKKVDRSITRYAFVASYRDFRAMKNYIACI